MSLAPPASVSHIGPYRLLEPLGHGGMGIVYRAEHGLTGQAAALKTVRLPNEGLLQSIRREIHALARIRHPGIVRILDDGVHEGLPWYAMELLEGTTLRQWFAAAALKSGGRKPGQQTEGGTAPSGNTPAEEPSAQTRQPAARALGNGGSVWWTQVREAYTGRTSSEAPPSPPHLEGQTASTGLGLRGPRSSEKRLRMPGGRSPRAAAGSRPAAAGGALAEVLTLVRRLCAPLAFLHGEGMVHRDLKPENVLIRKDGMPVLVDFGLMSQFSAEVSREALEVAMVAGTMAYMAPEQMRGELVDARADLYALGCLLYELVTRHRPFEGRGKRSAAEQHGSHTPLAPSELVDGVPAALDALVLRLLARRPQERLGYADDVAAALAELGAEDGLAASAPKPRAYLYRAGFVGRDTDLSGLQHKLSALGQGTGGLVLVGGESGVGKTRLVMEAAREAKYQALEVLTGECQAPAMSAEQRAASSERDGDSQLAPRGAQLSGGSPLHGLRQVLHAVADRCRQGGVEQTERLLAERGKLLALYEPALLGLPGQERYPEPAELPAEAARLRLYSYLAETFSALARERPVLLVLDDLQWADELTLEFLEFLLRSQRLERVALLIVGTYRTEEAHSGLQSLLRFADVSSVRLERLPEPAVGSMVRDMLALGAAPGLFVRYLSRHSEGNPFFVAEYLRTAIAERLLYRDSAGQWHVDSRSEGEATEELYEALPLPRSLQELVGRRLEGLSAPARALAEMASVFGREVDEALLEHVATRAGVSVLEAAQELVARQVLEEMPPRGLRFAHDKLREVAYQRLDARRRRELHRAAAEALEQHGSAEPASLGHHWQEAGDAAKARGYYLAAARKAQARNSYAEIERLYRAYLALVETPTAESIAARNELANQVLHGQSRDAEARDELGRALEEARQLGERSAEAWSLWGLGVIHGKLGPAELGVELLEQALRLFRELDDRLGEARSLRELGSVWLDQGRIEESRAAIEEAVTILCSLGDRREEGHALHALAHLHARQGQRFEQACDQLQQALAISREVGDRYFEAELLGFTGLLYGDMGRLEEAGVLIEQELALDRELGARGREAKAVLFLARNYFFQRQPERSLALAEQALALSRDLGRPQFTADALVGLACIHLEEGNLDQARPLFEQALKLYREMGVKWLELGVLRNLATVAHLSQAGPARVLELLKEAEAGFREIEHPLSVASMLCEQGHLALTQGLAADGYLEQATALVANSGVTKKSTATMMLERLRRAIDAAAAGETLVLGDRIEEIPEGQRRWLVKTGQVPAEVFEPLAKPKKRRPAARR